MIKDNFQFLKQNFSISNFKSNIWVWFSWCAFFIANSNDILKYALPFIVGLALISLSLFFLKKEQFRINIKTSNKIILFLSFFSSLSVSFFFTKKFYHDYSSDGNIVSFIEKRYSVNLDNLLKVFAIIVFFLLCALVIVLLNKVYNTLYMHFNAIFQENTALLILSLFLFLVLSFITVYCFHTSNYYTNNTPDYDIIFTSDSPYLLKTNIWIDIYNKENDLRQPLFGLFSIPLVAPFYSVGIILQWLGFNNGFIYAISISQIVILILSYLMLSNTILSKKNRIGFFFLISCSYMTLLFSIMPEQYIVAVFWLMFVLSNKYNCNTNTKLGVIASTGSLLTSGICVLTMWDRNKSIKENTISLLNIAFEGLFCFFSIGKLGDIVNVRKSINLYKGFVGERTSIINKFFQYSAFPINCILKPKSELTIVNDYFSWQLSKQDNVNLVGLIIIVLCIVSFLKNKKKIIAKISIGWIIFSFILLFVLGWGTAENGLILYSLYFGWAFIVLLHLLIENIFSLIKAERFIVPFEFFVSCFMFSINIIGIKDIIAFTAEYYPAI